MYKVAKIFSIFILALAAGVFVDADSAHATNTPGSYTQTNFRWRNDDGSESAATWKANLNTAITGASLTSRLRLRISVEETAGASGGTNGNFNADIYYSSNATACNNGTWTSMTAGGVWAFSDTTNITNGDATTQQISTGSGRSFQAGSINDTGSPAQISGFSNEVTEHEISLVSNGASPSTNYRFRVTRAGTALNTYSQCALLTTEAATTILADGTDPSNSTIAPGASATEIDRFNLSTNSGADTVTALTVTLGPANAYTNIATVDVQTTAGASKCSATPSSNTVSLTSCGIAVTTTPTDYKIMITPKTHANMASPATGASYATVATVTAFSSTNGQSGSDTDSATITVDNLSPANVTSASVSVGDEQNTFSWTNPGDADLSAVMVLASTSAITFTPVEGTTYSTSTLAGQSKVVCYGLQTSCTSSGLTNGTAYYYKIYTLDTRANWSDAGVTPTGSPATPVGTTYTQANYRFFATSTATTTAETWKARVPSQLATWRSVTYGGGLFVAVSYDGGPRVMTSPDGITWTARITETSLWRSVTYGNGLFVAVADTGTNRVMTSPDGITWTARSASEANLWYSVTYGNGLFVATGYGGATGVMTSPDGITWTARSAAQGNSWYSVTYGNGLFVAVSLDGTDRVMTSPNGITWTARSAVEANAWKSVTYGNGLFVAVTDAGTNLVMTSPDGITWTPRSAAEANGWQSVTYGNGLFVAVSNSGTNRVMTSPDGITWTAKSAAEANAWHSVTYGNGRFVAVAGTGTNRIMTADFTEGTALASQDTAATLTETGQKFILKQLLRVDTSSISLSRHYFRLQYAQKSGTCDTSFSGETYYDVGSSTPIAWYAQDIFDDNTLATSTSDLTDSGRTIRIQSNEKLNSFTNSQSTIASGEDGKWQFSLYDNGAPAGTTYCLRVVKTDETSWTKIDNGFSGAVRSVAYGNGIFVAVNNDSSPRVMTSPDGVNWTGRTAAEDNSWESVTYGNGVFVAVSTSGTSRVMTSPDGITWTGRTAAQANIWNSVTYGNGLFVAVSSSGTNYVMTSPDGITWTARSASENNSWQSVTYGRGLFVAVAQSGTNRVMTSPDGITWTARAAAAANGWRSVTYGNGIFVAVSFDGTDQVMTSPDGITWTARSAAEPEAWVEVTYGNGLFAAVENSLDGKVMTSPDGITWTTRFTVLESWGSIAHGNGIFVAAGASASVVSGSSTLDTYSQIPEITTKTAGPSLSLAHYRWRADTGGENASNFITTEDTAVTSNVIPGDRVRLRMLVSNTGGAATDYTYRVEYSSTPCSSWTVVPSYGSATSEHWSMDYSPHVSNASASSDNSGLTNPGGLSFTSGYIMTSSNQTPALTVGNNIFTELEYSLKSLAASTVDTIYCFRLTNAGATTNFTYTTEPRITLKNRAIRNIHGGVDFIDIVSGVLRIGGILFGGKGGGDEGVGSGQQQGGGGPGGGGGNTE